MIFKENDIIEIKVKATNFHIVIKLLEKVRTRGWPGFNVKVLFHDNTANPLTAAFIPEDMLTATSHYSHYDVSYAVGPEYWEILFGNR